MPSATEVSAPGKTSIEVLGKHMACVDTGAGDPIVFLHGNPTSSYLWRNVIPHLTDQGRCVAPDLIGMGDSDKIESAPDNASANRNRYDYTVHRDYLDGVLDALGVDDRVTLVLHDWGSALGFDWASRHPDRVLGIAYMEAIVQPMNWDDWPEPSRPLFEGLRSDAGESLILEKNVFIEKILPASVQRRMTDAEMDEYRRPYLASGEDRRPMLSWPRALPIDGEPRQVVEIVRNYAEWMATNELPKLFVNADPGAILVGAQRDFCRSWHNQTEVTVPGIHFIQEDSAAEIGSAIAAWRTDIC
jgi:haloalkane dehalogenase